MEMKEVFCIGETLIDFVDEAQTGDLAKVEVLNKKPGGAPANVATAVAKLGGKGYFIGAVGQDAFGDYLLNVLEENEVSIELAQRSDKFTTLAFVSLDKSGERSFEFSRGADEDLRYDASLKERFENNIVHFGAATALLGGVIGETYERYLADALVAGSYICFDPNFRDVLWEGKEGVFIDRSMAFVAKSHLCKFSLEEAQLLSGKDEIADASEFFHEAGVPLVVITLGGEGTYVSSGEFKKIIPSIEVNQVDTTGAGDAFIGCLLQQISSLENPLSITDDVQKLEDMIKNANKAGAITTTKFGAITALPDRSQVFG